MAPTSIVLSLEPNTWAKEGAASMGKTLLVQKSPGCGGMLPPSPANDSTRAPLCCREQAAGTGRMSSNFTRTNQGFQH